MENGGIIIASLFQTVFLQFYEGHVRGAQAVDQVIPQVNFFIRNKMVLSRSLILALQITRATAIRSVTTIFLAVTTQLFNYITNKLLVN